MRMKQFKTIYRFEMSGFLKNKAYVIVTLLLVIGILVLLTFPRIKEMSGSSDKDEKATAKTKVALFIEGGIDKELAKRAFAEEDAFSDDEIVVADNIDDLKKKILDGEYVCGYVIHDLNNYSYCVKNMSMSNSSTSDSDIAMKNLNYQVAMKEAGVSDDAIKKAADAQITGVPEVLGENQSQGFFYTYFMIFALYIIIMLYGQMVATNVAAEKGSRAMEVLITSAKPTSLMFGKILAACTAGLGQLVLVFGSAYLGYQVNASYWEDNPVITSIFAIPLDIVLYMILFFLLGFLLYAVMYGAIGSMATKVEDINTLSTPIMLVFVAAFIIVILGMNDDVNNTLMVVASYVPFTSPMAMFTRIAMGGAVWYEIIISAVILIVSTFAIGVYSAKIYRAGVLHYGKTPSFMEILGKAKTE